MRGVLVALLVIASVTTSLGMTTPVAASTSTADCSNVVRFDEFRFDNETVSAATNDSANVTKDNAKVRIEQATGFIRIHASNPNGYCVAFEVHIDDRIVEPAELGNVESNDESETAEWHAIRDFNTDETFTKVTFTLGPAESTTFAASELRVESLSWTGTAKSAGSSFWDGFNVSIGDKGEEPLQERTYYFSAENNSTYVSVSLSDESTGRAVEEWQAMYRTDAQDWTPVSTDSDDPVFYRMVGDETVQFAFNDPSAEVRFTANPTIQDKASYQLDSYQSGWDAISNFGPFGDDEDS